MLGIAHVGYIYALECAGIRFRWVGAALWAWLCMHHTKVVHP